MPTRHLQGVGRVRGGSRHRMRRNVSPQLIPPSRRRPRLQMYTHVGAFGNLGHAVPELMGGPTYKALAGPQPSS